MFEVFYQSIQKQKRKKDILWKTWIYSYITYILLNKKTMNNFADDKILKYLANTLIVTFKI